MYQLAPLVYACTTGRNCMFLDLRRDRYLSVPQTLMNALAPAIQDWKLSVPTTPCPEPSPEEVRTLAHELLAAGLLCPCDALPGASREPLPVAHSDIASHTCHRRHSSAPGCAMRVTAALIAADYALHRVALHRIAESVARKKQRGGPRFRRDHLSTAIALTSRFAQVRPWYPRDYLCLFDSLALMLYLLRCGSRAHWVFGVREQPFAAHCWIQHGSVVLNETFDRAHLYTPIMAI